MEERQDPKASTAGGTPERDAEATSSETLSDIEANEKVRTGGGTGSPLEGSSPKPDSGGGGGRADGSDSGGPM